MAALRFSLSAIAALALGMTLSSGPVLAQDAGAAATEETDAPAPGGTGFHPGEEVQNFGEDYILETHGAWEVRCVRTQDGFDPCRIYQLLLDPQQNPVAEFAVVALPGGSEAAAGATVITPLETLLTAQLTMTVDGGRARRYPFTWCSPIGCFARIGFTEAEIAALRGGRNAVITIVPVVAPDQQVNLGLSLTGFTAAYNSMQATNAATQQRAEEAAAAAGEAPAAGGN